MLTASPWSWCAWRRPPWPLYWPNCSTSVLGEGLTLSRLSWAKSLHCSKAKVSHTTSTRTAALLLKPVPIRIHGIWQKSCHSVLLIPEPTRFETGLGEKISIQSQTVLTDWKRLFPAGGFFGTLDTILTLGIGLRTEFFAGLTQFQNTNFFAIEWVIKMIKSK